MSAEFDSITNRGEYFAAHFFAEGLPDALKKGVLRGWTDREKDEYDQRRTPRQLVRSLRQTYLAPNMRAYFAEQAEAAAEALASGKFPHTDDELIKRLGKWHRCVLTALGFLPSFDDGDNAVADVGPEPLIVHRSGREHEITVAWHGNGIVALDCGWTASTDAALDEQGAARLLYPVRVSAGERYETGPKLASWLFGSEIGEPGKEAPPRFVLLLCGGVIVLADRQSWAEGRFIAANLDIALERNDTKQTGELATIAALFAVDMLKPLEDGTGVPLDALLKASTENAVGVGADKSLRAGLQRSVEIIANEVLARLREAGVAPEEIEDPKIAFAKQLTSETLRYLYRILFLLYAEARPELRILPADDGSYEAGYSVARLRELVALDEVLVEADARTGFHLYESLDLLFRKVNTGHRPWGTEPDDDQPGDDDDTREEKAKRRSESRGLRFEALRSELFEPDAITLIGRRATSEGTLDLRLRNAALHEVLRLLTMKKGRGRGAQGGFISYRNLGINQLGAVYEGLMSYTGIIAEEKLCEVAKKGEPEKGSWLIPAHRQGDYPADTLVKYDEHDALHGLRGPKVYEAGTFVYRLAGRDRETSASYYTPESLTKVTVELALKHWLLEQGGADTPAARLLELKICEPALGSGAFLNEAINQVAEEYLRRREKERDQSVPTERALEEKQRVKAYIALHNAYGVDLNATGVELAEVSVWLNTMYPGMRAPWFGLHLRRGNSLIGARRAVYDGEEVIGRDWLRSNNPIGPTPLPFLTDGQPNELPDDAVHQFLLPNIGWGAVHGSKEAKELTDLAPLKAWRRGILKRPKTTGGKASQATRLKKLARRVEFLWALVVKRMELSEEAISRRIDVWGAEQDDPDYGFLRQPEHATPKEQVLADLFNASDTPYGRLKQVMDAWCALWFWPAGKAALLDGTAPDYAEAEDHTQASLAALLGTIDTADTTRNRTWIEEQTQLFAVGAEQGTLDAPTDGEFPAETRQYRKKQPKLAAPAPTRRSVPLVDLDDWLTFLEAMLGTADVPEEGLFLRYTDLDRLKEYEDELPTHMGMYRGDPEDRFPWLREVRNITEEQGFLHWELEFALIFARNGGFDLQVGNPPWVRPRWEENPVFAEFEPWFELREKPPAAEKSRRRTELLDSPVVRGYVAEEATKTAAQVALFGSPQTYPRISGTQPNLYRAFMTQVWANASSSGMAGMLHPDTHFVGEDEGKLRAAAYHRLRIHGDFVNVNHRFFPKPVDEKTHLGVQVYGPVLPEIAFDHLSWLVSADQLRHSKQAQDVPELPEYRIAGVKVDERPHPARVVEVDATRLSTWRRLLGSNDDELAATRLLFPVSQAELRAIEVLAKYPHRLGMLSPRISRGYDESGAKKDKIIEYNQVDPATGAEYQPPTWRQVVLESSQFGLATPTLKRHDANSNDPHGIDLVGMSDDFVPSTEYVRVRGQNPQYLAKQDRWVDPRSLAFLSSNSRVLAMARAEAASAHGTKESAVSQESVVSVLMRWSRRRYATFYRAAWRERVVVENERGLHACILPRGVAHVHDTRSAYVVDNLITSLLAGFWTSVAVDYFLRISNTKHLDVGFASRMPVPQARHPLAHGLLLRTLRLNCVTTAYRRLWREVYDPVWRQDGWVVDWPRLAPLQSVGPEWNSDTPLRTERERRSALVEIDALVAVWLGMDSDSLIAAYRGRFPVLQKYEGVTWFDANGSKIAGNARTYGQQQTKESWKQFQLYLMDKDNNPVPDGYTAPFYKAEREKEMRAAHAVFQARLDAAVAAGEWDPVRQEVPGT